MSCLEFGAVVINERWCFNEAKTVFTYVMIFYKVIDLLLSSYLATSSGRDAAITLVREAKDCELSSVLSAFTSCMRLLMPTNSASCSVEKSHGMIVSTSNGWIICEYRKLIAFGMYRDHSLFFHWF